MTEQLPSDRQRAARIALAVLAGALGTALIGAAVWAVFGPRPPETPAIDAGQPSAESSVTTAPPPVSQESSSTSSPPQPPSSGSVRPPKPSSPSRAAMVAYRKDGRIWVSGENGQNPQAVSFGYRTYSLSPDGKTLAIVPGDGEPTVGTSEAPGVALLDLTRTAMDAAAETPSWAGTSEWLAFAGASAKRPAVFRLDAAGAPLRRVAMPASSPRASADGRHVAYRAGGAGSRAPIEVARSTGGSTRPVPGSEVAVAWSWGAEGSLYFVVPGKAPGSWRLLRAAVPYESTTSAGSFEVPAPAFSVADSAVSPDGRRVLISAIGDDDYSRLWVLDIRAKRIRAIPTRRDAYSYGWSADGSRVLYFEGNTYQGEPTALMSCRVDGSGRRIVVPGAYR